MQAAVGCARRAFSTTGVSKPGLFKSIFVELPSQSALSEEFPGVPALQNQAAQPKGKVSILSNGLKVVSHDKGSGVANFGVYVTAGSRYENVAGTAAVLEQIAFHDTQKRSTMKIQRDTEDIGAVTSARAGREVFGFTGEVLRDGLDSLAEIVSEAVTQPKFNSWDVKETKHAFEPVLDAQKANAKIAVTEALHAAAFGATSPLGHSLLTPNTSDLEDVDAAALRSFLGARFAARNMVVVGVNVDHQALEDVADKYLLSVPEGLDTHNTKPAFIGGESLIRTNGEGPAHVAVALEAPGLNAGPKGTAALGVLQALLGGSAPTGLVAAPKQSRIARSVHTEAHSFIHSLSSFVFPYSDVSVLGLAGSCADHEAGRLVDAMAGFLKDAAGGLAISGAELDRAKRSFKLAYLSNLDSRAGLSEDIAHSILLTGKQTATADVLAAVDALTAADVQAVAKQALSSKPALAASGSLQTIQRYDIFASLFA